MVHTITLKELRPELPEVINNVDSKLDRYIVTKRGKPIAVVLSIDEYESLLETLDILSDQDSVKRIIKAEKEIKEGKTVSFDQVNQDIKNDLQS